MARQLLAVEFTPGGRAYTYHNDGAPVAVGDDVLVMTKASTRSNSVAKTVRVVSVNPLKPTVPTKSIVGKADRRQPPQQRPLL